MSRRRNHFPRAGGFTLIEVLVALVIVAVGMSALMGALTSSARTVTYMQDKTFSEWVALNQIATVRLQLIQGQVPPAGNTTGDIDLANRTWHWRQEVVASQVPGIMRIDVKVRPKDIKAGDDDSWYVTMSGLAGNALAAPGSATIQWNPLQGAGLQGGANNPGTSLGGGSNNNSGSKSGGSGTGSSTTTTTNPTGKTP